MKNINRGGFSHNMEQLNCGFSRFLSIYAEIFNRVWKICSLLRCVPSSVRIGYKVSLNRAVENLPIDYP